jgi:NADH dehydrogenase
VWDLLFARDLVTLKLDQTERVSHAYFRQGDYIFRQGDPAMNSYSVERGEVDIIRSNPLDDSEQPVAVLGPGEYFGEMALLEHRTRSASARARTDVGVTTMGAEVFSRLSQSLAPLKQRLAESLRRRSVNLPTRMPEVHAVLQGESLADFIEVAPATLQADSPFLEALRRFAQDRVDVLYVVEDHERLVGVLTKTDLLRAVDAAISVPIERREEFSVRQFMSPDPIAVTVGDSAAAAAATLWSRGMKMLPVLASSESRRVAGCIRAETLMHAVIGRLRAHRAPDIRRPIPDLTFSARDGTH